MSPTSPAAPGRGSTPACLSPRAPSREPTGAPARPGGPRAVNRVGRRSQVHRPEAASFELVADDAALRDVIAALASQPVYALDTEFHREKTYYPRVALVQVAWDGDLVLIDPIH